MEISKEDKITTQKLIDETQATMPAKTLLVIKSKPKLTAVDEGVELNEGYEFEVNGAIPEIADAIAKFAKELEPNGFGEGSGGYFVTLIQEYFNKI